MLSEDLGIEIETGNFGKGSLWIQTPLKSHFLNNNFFFPSRISILFGLPRGEYINFHKPLVFMGFLRREEASGNF